MLKEYRGSEYKTYFASTVTKLARPSPLRYYILNFKKAWKEGDIAMAEGMPQGELLRRSLEWILAEQAEGRCKSVAELVDEAGMRYNLSPSDGVMLLDLLKKNKNIQTD